MPGSRVSSAMAVPSAPSGGTIPLTEYRRDVPPGWQPGDSSYSLRAYLEKLRMWYRISSLEDELVGPVIAGRLYGRAHRVAVSLRVPRPDGTYDIGDAALVRLPVDEVRDPATNELLQEHIPSGVQYLVNALRAAFGQMDQDLATSSLEAFFGLTRHGNKLSLSEYSVEFDSRYDEASDRAGLQLNDVGKFFLWFRGSGLPSKTIDDIKLQVNGDFTRFNDARALALRITPNKENHQDIFYGQDEDSWWQDPDEHYYQYYEDDENYYEDDSYDWWYGYEEEADGEWTYEYEENYDTDWNGDGDGSTWPEPPTTEADAGATSSNAEFKEEYYKGKGKGGHDGCFNCGSKWHMARDCPMAKGGQKGGGKQGRGTWRAVWRPRSKGKGKGKFRKGFGKGKGKKGKGKNHWFSGSANKESAGNMNLDFREGVPDHTTSMTMPSQRMLFRNNTSKTGGRIPEKHIIHTSSEEDDFMSMRRPLASTTSSTTAATEVNQEEETSKPSKQHSFNFPTFHNSIVDGQYFAVRGEKRYGLLIDPGAASGLVGSDTLLQLMDNCVKPAVKQDEMIIDHGKTVPVSGISGVSENTLGQVTLPLVQLVSGGQSITYTADVLGGDGSFCPALVGNPALREMNAVMFCNWFNNGDGLILVGSQQDDAMHHRMFRLLLTDSGHYMLPTDHDHTAKVAGQTKREAVLFCARAASRSAEIWPDVNPQVHHCFLSNVGKQAAGDRSEQHLHQQHDNDPSPHQQHDNDPSPHQQLENDNLQHQQHDNDPSLRQHPEHNEDKNRNFLKPKKKVRFVENVGPGGEVQPVDQVQPVDPSGQHQQLPGGVEGNIKEPTFVPAVSADHAEAVSHHAILATEEMKVSSHDTNKHDVLEFKYETPAEDFVPHDGGEAILANWSSTPYIEDTFPPTADKAKLNRRYKAIPEEYYTKTGLHPVTPQNFNIWFAKAKGRGLRWHAWEICSGSGRLSLVLLLAGLVIGFPVDYRYGWDTGDRAHQQMLLKAPREFQPGYIHCSLDCAPWSQAGNTKDPKERQQERIQARPSLEFTMDVFNNQARHPPGYGLEQPWGSAMWNPGTINPLDLDQIPGNKKK